MSDENPFEGFVADGASSRVRSVEHWIRRVGFPLFGLGGIIWEELTTADPLLIGTYLALAGFGSVPWLRDIYKRGG